MKCDRYAILESKYSFSFRVVGESKDRRRD
jgi:hypothetical protein